MAQKQQSIRVDKLRAVDGKARGQGANRFSDDGESYRLTDESRSNFADEEEPEEDEEESEHLSTLQKSSQNIQLLKQKIENKAEKSQIERNFEEEIIDQLLKVQAQLDD